MKAPALGHWSVLLAQIFLSFHVCDNEENQQDFNVLSFGRKGFWRESIPFSRLNECH